MRLQLVNCETEWLILHVALVRLLQPLSFHWWCNFRLSVLHLGKTLSPGRGWHCANKIWLIRSVNLLGDNKKPIISFQLLGYKKFAALLCRNHIWKSTTAILKLASAPRMNFSFTCNQTRLHTELDQRSAQRNCLNIHEKLQRLHVGTTSYLITTTATRRFRLRTVSLRC